MPYNFKLEYSEEEPREVETEWCDRKSIFVQWRGTSCTSRLFVVLPARVLEMAASENRGEAVLHTIIN